MGWLQKLDGNPFGGRKIGAGDLGGRKEEGGRIPPRVFLAIHNHFNRLGPIRLVYQSPAIGITNITLRSCLLQKFGKSGVGRAEREGRRGGEDQSLAQNLAQSSEPLQAASLKDWALQKTGGARWLLQMEQSIRGFGRSFGKEKVGGPT